MKLYYLLAVCLSWAFTVFAGENPVYYIKVTNTRTYMNVDRVTVSEYWYANGNYCTVRNQDKIIFRYDQGLRYFVNMRNGTYRVDSIKPPRQNSPSTGPDIKYVGRFHNPVYEWKKTLKLAKDTVGAFKWNHFKCEGDDDFDQISVDFFMTKVEDASFAGFVNSTIFNLKEGNNKVQPMFSMVHKSKNMIPIRSIEKVENPIAPYILTKINLDKVEKVKTPEGIFDVPASYKKTN